MGLDSRVELPEGQGYRGGGGGEGAAGATRRELEEHGEAAVFPSPPWFWQLRIFRKARRVSIGVAEKEQRVHEQEYEGDRVQKSMSTSGTELKGRA